MLGDRLLGVAVQAQGTLKDVGGQAFYANLSKRWNWAVAGGHIPYQSLFQYIGVAPPAPGSPGNAPSRRYLGLQRVRVFVTSAEGQIAYPFSSTRRIEFGGGAVRYAYEVEEDRYFLNQTGQFLTGEVERVDVDIPCDNLTADERLLGATCTPEPLQVAQGSAAYVGDNTFFGFTSPIRGGRFRFGIEGTAGSENFITATADWRRYYAPHRNLTVAVRGLHFGRYGNIVGNVIRPMFLGYETFVRGYSYESLEPEECTISQQQLPADETIRTSTCPTFTRLFGHRLAVANFELRVPFLGVEQFGLINFPYVPVELLAFADAGLAWDADNTPLLEFSSSSTDRVPVFSVGAAARFNVLGFMILEAYYAFPFQRPDKGPHWGFQIAPGW
jgi:hypothetical protein